MVKELFTEFQVDVRHCRSIKHFNVNRYTTLHDRNVWAVEKRHQNNMELDWDRHDSQSKHRVETFLSKGKADLLNTNFANLYS